MPTQTQSASPGASPPRLCAGVFESSPTLSFITLFWMCLKIYPFVSFFFFNIIFYCVHGTRAQSHTHTHARSTCQSQNWCMQTLLLSLSLNLLSGVRHIIVFMAPRIWAEIFRLLTLWKSHLFSAAICKYSTMNLVNRVNHSVRRLAAPNFFFFIFFPSSHPPPPSLKFTSFKLEMFSVPSAFPRRSDVHTRGTHVYRRAKL